MLRSLVLAAALLAGGAGLAMAQTELEGEGAAPPPADVVITDQQEEEVLSSDLIGSDVMHPQGEKIGTLESLLFDSDEKIVGGVVSVGGFLGIGAKQVALSWDAFEVHRDQGLLIVDLTQEQLAQAPMFKDLAQIEAEQEAERAQQEMQQQQMQQQQLQQDQTQP